MGRVFFASALCVSSRIYISCVFQQDLESKFLEFSFGEKYLLPSVPAFWLVPLSSVGRLFFQ